MQGAMTYPLSSRAVASSYARITLTGHLEMEDLCENILKMVSGQHSAISHLQCEIIRVLERLVLDLLPRLLQTQGVSDM